MNKFLSRYLEFSALFILLPTAIVYFHLHGLFIVILWLFAAFCWFNLREDESFDRRKLSNFSAFNKKSLKDVLFLFSLGCMLIMAYTYVFEPARFLGFVSNRTAMWAMVMVLYPVLSVYPQEIIYRSFFFHRYAGIFGEGNRMLLISAASFAYAHIIFQNFLAVALCFIGGLIFGRTYKKHNSLLLVSLEHALYGCLIFTAGLGYYFFRGAVQ